MAEHPEVLEHSIGLANSVANFGNLLAARGNPQEALQLYSRAFSILEPIIRKEPRLVNVRRFLRNAHEGRATALVQLKRFADALTDWERAIILDDDPFPAPLQIARADSPARAGRSA